MTETEWKAEATVTGIACPSEWEFETMHAAAPGLVCRHEADAHKLHLVFRIRTDGASSWRAVEQGISRLRFYLRGLPDIRSGSVTDFRVHRVDPEEEQRLMSKIFPDQDLKD